MTGSGFGRLAVAALMAAAGALASAVLVACGSSVAEERGDQVLARGVSPLGRSYEIAVAGGGSRDSCIAITYGKRHGGVCGGSFEGAPMQVLPAVSGGEVVVTTLLKPSVATVRARIVRGGGASGSAKALTVAGTRLAHLVLPLAPPQPAGNRQGASVQLQVQAVDRAGRVIDTEALGVGTPVPAR